MKRNKDLCRRWLALFLSFVLCVGMLSTTAFATGEGTPQETEITQAAPEAPEEPAAPTPKPEAQPEPTPEPDPKPEVTPDPPTPTEPPAEPGQDEETTEPEVPGQTEKPAEPETPGQGEEPRPEDSPVEDDIQTAPPEQKPDDSSDEPSDEPANEPTEEPPAVVEIPAIVQDFLDAVKAIPKITLDNAIEVAEYVYGKVSEAYEALLGTQYMFRTDVQMAVATYAAAVKAVDAALEMNSGTLASGYTPVTNVTINPSKKPTGQTATGKVRNSGQSLTMKVGQKGSFLLGAPTNTLVGSRCGHTIAVYNPSDYCDISLIDNSGQNLVGNPTYAAGNNNGARVFDTVFEALKPGSSNDVRVCYYANFGIVFTNPNLNYAYVPCWCGVNSLVYKDIKWYRYNDVFGITVNADYVLNYDTQGGSAVSPTKQAVPATSASFTVTNTKPSQEGYTFKGWAETPNATSDTKLYQAGDSITLNWSEGKGSSANPVSKTLYALWEEDNSEPDSTTYTVLYTDGVPDKTVFADQGFEGLIAGAKTPAFEEENGKTETVTDADGKTVVKPIREGYTFMGWAPAINPVVSADDADENGVITYTATWKKDKAPTQYTVTYTWTGLPEGTTEPQVPDAKTYDVNATVTVDTTFVKDFEVTIGDKTYVFSGWSTSDITIDNGTFTMPEKHVTIHGTWTVKATDPGPGPGPETPETIVYKVIRYVLDAVTDNTEDAEVIDSDERNGTLNQTVEVTESDKILDGYTFIQDYNGNVLSATLDTAGKVLKLYFTKDPVTPPEPKEVTYTVEWYDTNGNTIKPTATRTDKAGSTVSVTDNDKVISGYTFVPGDNRNVLSDTLADDGNTVLKLYFSRNSGGGSSRPDPDPKPPVDPEPPVDPDPPVDPEPPVDVPDPDVPLVPPPEEPPVVDVPEEDPPLVDIPEAQPPLVEVPDTDVPQVNVPQKPKPPKPQQPQKTQQPQTDIPDEAVPLAEVPQTGDNSGLWASLLLLSGAGLTYLLLDEKKRRDNSK